MSDEKGSTGNFDKGVSAQISKSWEARLEEAVGLARAIDLTIAEALVAPVSQIRPATYLGKGKVDELAGLIKETDVLVRVVGFTDEKGGQERNIPLDPHATTSPHAAEAAVTRGCFAHRLDRSGA